MGTKYIPCVDGAKRFIMEYDTNNGFDVRGERDIFIFHHSLIVSGAYDSEEEALKHGFGCSSMKPVEMPDGRLISPMEYFYPKEYLLQDILKPWHPGVTEKVCSGESW